MGSSSTTSQPTTNTTNNLQMSRDFAMQQGTAILDSIVVDTNAPMFMAQVAAMKGNFETLMDGQKVGLSQLVELADSVLELVEKNQVGMSGMMQAQLEATVQWLKDAQAQGRYVLDFAEKAVDQSYGLAGQVVDNQNDALFRALDITADVQTGDYSQNLRILAGMTMLFALGAIWLIRKGKV